MTPCDLIKIYRNIGGKCCLHYYTLRLFYLEDGGSMFSRNIAKLLPDSTATHNRCEPTTNLENGARCWRTKKGPPVDCSSVQSSLESICKYNIFVWEGQDFPAVLPASLKILMKVSSFYKSLNLGYFSLGVRIGRCEHHKRAHDIRTAVHRRANHKYLLLVHCHRLLYTQGRVTDGQERFLQKLVAHFRATWCLFMVYFEDVVSKLLWNVASDLV